MSFLKFHFANTISNPLIHHNRIGARSAVVLFHVLANMLLSSHMNLNVISNFYLTFSNLISIRFIDICTLLSICIDICAWVSNLALFCIDIRTLLSNSALEYRYLHLSNMSSGQVITIFFGHKFSSRFHQFQRQETIYKTNKSKQKMVRKIQVWYAETFFISWWSIPNSIGS